MKLITTKEGGKYIFINAVWVVTTFCIRSLAVLGVADIEKGVRDHEQ